MQIESFGFVRIRSVASNRGLSPSLSTMSGLEEFVEKTVSVVTNDGRIIIGNLRGFDQNVNCILEDSRERMFSSDSPMIEVLLGLYIIRGDNIAVIGELDESLDAQTDWDMIRTDPLKPVVH